jgi:hypothetical protein
MSAWFWIGLIVAVLGLATWGLARATSREMPPYRAAADTENCVIRLPCPTCSGPVRETVGMVCQTCGTDYSTSPPLHIQQNLFKHGVGPATDNIYIDDVRPGDLGPPPTYPETPEEHTR